jgi:hypothetical protein
MLKVSPGEEASEGEPALKKNTLRLGRDETGALAGKAPT